jgi:hypothetical protein
MTILKAPAGTLTDGVVELRLPSPEVGDITTINRYVEDEQLEGGWLPGCPAGDWRAAGKGLAGLLEWSP